MKKINFPKRIVGTIVIFVVVGLLSFLFLKVYVNYIYGYDYFAEKLGDKRLDGLIKIIGVAISVTGFLSIILTIYYTEIGIRREIEQNSINLFREFRSKDFFEVRKNAWKIKEKWNNHEYQKELIKYLKEDAQVKPQNELDYEIQTMYDLLEFYCILSHYSGNPESFKKLKYFYYGYWRPLLYSFSNFIDELRKEDISSIIILETDYFKNISYSTSLNKLDEICGFTKYDKNLVFHAKGF